MYRFHEINRLTLLSRYRHESVATGDLGTCRLPREFAIFTGDLGVVEVRDARESPRDLQTSLAQGKSLVLTGPYAYIDAVYRYCQRFERRLVDEATFEDLAHRGRRKAALTEARRQRLHHLLVAVRGECLLKVEDPPDTAGLQEWLQEPTGEVDFLIPVRRLQRILTDMERALEGVPIDALDGRLTILPHVYVPADREIFSPRFGARFSM